MPKRSKEFKDYTWDYQNKLKRRWIDNPSDNDEPNTSSGSDEGRSDESRPEQQLPPVETESDSDRDVGNIAENELHSEVSNAEGSPSSNSLRDSERNGTEQENIESDEDSVHDSINDIPSETSSDGRPESVFQDDADEFDEIQGNYDHDRDEFDGDEPLYNGASITESESVIAIWSYALRHNLNATQLSDLLELVALHCPPRNKCKRTLYTFKKYFSGHETPLIKHYHCAQCFQSVENQDSACPRCGDDSKINYFIEGPVVQQIEALFKRPGFSDALQNRFTRDRINPEAYEDIYDGAVYRELCQNNGFLANPDNFSMTWYTDGLSIFKSSKFCIWPVYLMINELPFSERTKKENIVLAGLWFGDEKPFPNLFLNPLRASLTQLRQGINVQTSNRADPINVKGMIICGTCDLPAKALFLNMKQYNGKFGCQKCKEPGVYLNDERVRVYPSAPFTLRTQEETNWHAQEALRTGEPVCGVKGATVLSLLIDDNIRSISVDSMHCVFEGVARALLYFWFSPNFAIHPSSLIQYIDLVDKRLTSLTPPSSIQRLFRSIEKHLAYWKAHEIKTWLFYSSIPCINDIMDPEYYDHYKLLVLGITLLSQSSVTQEDVDIASRALEKFVSDFEALYGLRYMTNNLHQLRHLAENVRQFGPLFTTSCFAFEDLNGKMKRLVHGSNAPQLQIYSATSSYLHLTTLKNLKLTEGTRAHSFCENLDYKIGRIKRHKVTDSMYMVGNCRELSQLSIGIDQIFARSNLYGTRYQYFQRLLKRKIMFCGTEYTRSTRTNSTYALYSSHDGSQRIGRVSCFIRAADCACLKICHCIARNYAILRPCIIANPLSTSIDNTVLLNIHTITNMENEEVAVRVEDLKSVCYYCEIDEPFMQYVIEPVNSVECE